MKTGYVVFDEIMGIYLGEDEGFGFWSGLDSSGQDVACVFASEAEAMDCVNFWTGPPPTAVKFVEVVVDLPPHHASMVSCIKAGLPGWITEETPVANVLPA